MTAGRRAETRYPAPFAVLGIMTGEGVVTGVRYLPPATVPLPPHDRVAERACREIERYLADSDYLFTVPYRLEGTPFQHRVWREIEKLCPIKTITYGAMARRLRSGTGLAPLIVPCHRVLAAGGGLGGFMGGKYPFPLSVKRWLLRHEGILEADH